MVPMMTFFSFVFLGLVLLFGGYLKCALPPLKDTVGYDDGGVETRRRRIAWSETRKLDLRFYSTSRAGRRRGLGLTTSVDYHQVAADQARSARGQGWLQLTIEGPDVGSSSIPISSGLTKSRAIARRPPNGRGGGVETTQENSKRSASHRLARRPPPPDLPFFRRFPRGRFRDSRRSCGGRKESPLRLDLNVCATARSPTARASTAPR